MGSGGTTGAGGSSTGGTTGTGGATGTGGTTGTAGSAGTTGTGGATGTAGAMGAAGATGAAGAMGTGGTTGAGGAGSMIARGRSAGCGMPPAANDSTSNFVLKEIHVTGVTNPAYLAGGVIYKSFNIPSGKYDFQFRPYSVKLPKNYDPTKAYPVVLGGGGCGGTASNFANNPGGGYQPDNTGSSLQVGLQYVDRCFADGGGDFAKNKLLDTPEVPYVRQVIAEVENHYCVDKSMVFETGTSSGGWESFTTGCAAGDLIRAIGPVSGGLRMTRPPCTGPQAAIMVESLGDTANPIGPIVPFDQSLDSAGSAPARDEILKRNGCVAPDYVFDYSDTTTKLGSAPHDTWDPMYPRCVKYTGCPAAYPVVWCALQGCGHQCDNQGTVSYRTAIWQFWMSLGSLP
jgi:poly(3-hydroxybutyrate) depolymerase